MLFQRLDIEDFWREQRDIKVFGLVYPRLVKSCKVCFYSFSETEGHC